MWMLLHQSSLWDNMYTFLLFSPNAMFVVIKKTFCIEHDVVDDEIFINMMMIMITLVMRIVKIIKNIIVCNLSV